MDSPLWQKVLDQIKREITPANFRIWFSQTLPGESNDNKLVIIVPSAFNKSNLITKYEGLIKETVKSITQKESDVEFVIDPGKFSKTIVEEEEDPFEFSPSIATPAPTTTLNPKYTLENFVVGTTNNLAYAAAQAVVQNPGISYNPLFIYGPSGVGKTHLMQGIGNELMKKNPYGKLLFVSSERFMNDFVDSIQNKKTASFREKYRSCDLLLVDDIQFISGKEGFQEEFFHTFNELHYRNTQLVFTSDRPPHEIQKLEARLSSRFQGGLMVDIQLPDVDTRMAILKAKLQERGDTLPEDCIKAIAEAVASNTRELEGKLIQIIQVIKLEGQLPALERVQQLLGRTQTITPKTGPMDSQKILEIINQYFNVTLQDLTGPRRQKELVLPRQIAMYILYEDAKIPMEKIGHILGGRDHTTILHGIEKIREAVTRDREVQRLLIEVKQNLIN